MHIETFRFILNGKNNINILFTAYLSHWKLSFYFKWK